MYLIFYHNHRSVRFTQLLFLYLEMLNFLWVPNMMDVEAIRIIDHGILQWQRHTSMLVYIILMKEYHFFTGRGLFSIIVWVRLRNELTLYSPIITLSFSGLSLELSRSTLRPTLSIVPWSPVYCDESRFHQPLFTDIKIIPASFQYRQTFF